MIQEEVARCAKISDKKLNAILEEDLPKSSPEYKKLDKACNDLLEKCEQADDYVEYEELPDDEEDFDEEDDDDWEDDEDDDEEDDEVWDIEVENIGKKVRRTLETVKTKKSFTMTAIAIFLQY